VSSRSVGLFQTAPRPASLLEVFLQRYANLLRFAESLTRDRREAEDLVQDACVRLLVAPPDISHVENVDAYLFAALRNLHTTRTRRHQLRPEAHLSIVDFDSADFALEALSQTSSLHARDALRTACRFACARRFTSKTASLFILHFFHGYVRSEIGAIANLRRVSVDTGLTRGRVEIRAYLDDPDAALRASGLDAIPDLRVDAGRPGDGDDYLARLRAAIFALRHPRCFDTRFLRQAYADPATPISTEMLADLVACPRCLDTVNRMTQLPVLAERHPRDTHEPNGPHEPREPREPRAGSRRAATRHDHEQRMCRLAAEQTARTIRAHRPRALRVLVNGFQIGSHDLTAEVTRATHALAGPEPPRVVEIYSEQRVCLATLQVETVPDAAVSQQTTIALDDGRRLELNVVFDAPWPTLHLAFMQPIDESPAGEWIEAPHPNPLAEPVVARPREQSVESDVDDPEPSASVSGTSWLRAWLRPTSWAPRPVLVGLAVVVLVVVMIGPGRAWSAVADAGRTLVKWVSDVVSDAPTSGARSGPGSSGHDTRGADIELRTPATFPAPAPASAPARALRGLTESALLGLEVDVLERLDRAGALYGEDLTLTRPRSGYLRLEGLVDQPERRRALVDALGALASIPQFEVRLRAVPETPSAAAVETPTSTRVFEVERDQSPASRVLADALIKQGVAAGPPADDMARALAVRVMNASQRALRHTWAFKRLARQIQGDRLRIVDPDAHRRWQELLRDHVTAFTTHSAQVQAELTAIGLLPGASNEPGRSNEPDIGASAEASVATATADVNADSATEASVLIGASEAAAEQFVELAEQQDRSVRALFAGATADTAIDVHQTLRDLAAQLRASAILAQRLLDR
jgi:RNA polymerase sigma factor (sigma-70 family)